MAFTFINLGPPHEPEPEPEIAQCETPPVFAALGAMETLAHMSREHGSWAVGAEQMEVDTETTGYMGGDRGHGGLAEVAFHITGGSHRLEISVPIAELQYALTERTYLPNGFVTLVFDDVAPMDVTITARGDWEQAGLIACLRTAWLNMAWRLEKAFWPKKTPEGT